MVLHQQGSFKFQVIIKSLLFIPFLQKIKNVLNPHGMLNTYIDLV